MTTQPRYAIGNRVTIYSGRGAVWKIKGIEEPTRAQPQYGYRVERENGNGHSGKTVDEDKLRLAETEVRA